MLSTRDLPPYSPGPTKKPAPDSARYAPLPPPATPPQTPLNVGARPPLQKSRATIFAIAPLLNCPPVNSFNSPIIAALCLSLLPIKQPILRRQRFRDRLKGNHRCRKTSLLQNHTRSQKMPNPVQYHSLPILVPGRSPKPVFSFNRDPVRNRMPPAKRPDLSGIQVVKVIRHLPLLVCSQA